MKLSNELYNALKWLAQIGLPAIATLYFALAAIFGWPDADKVVGSITAVDAFLGASLQFSSAKFSKDNTLVLIKKPPSEPPAA
jgi:hypothetical protein